MKEEASRKRKRKKLDEDREEGAAVQLWAIPRGSRLTEPYPRLPL
jgi:hypothetical protein